MTLKTLRGPILLAGICLILASGAFAQFAIPAQTVSGGASAMTGTAFGIKGTVGQTVAGTMAIGGFRTEGGFWFEVLTLAEPNAIQAPAPVTPSRFALAQNYPNPFNPVTQIRFALPKASRVVVKVFNLNGALVETLVDADLNMGEHQLTWNADHYASGTYLVRMSAPGFSEVRKAVLLK
jgi:hypothetical protein